MTAVPLPGADQQDYADYAYAAHPLERVPDFVLRRLDEIVRSFEPFRRAGRLLDVGFGSGALMKAAKDAGWEVHGIEVSSLAVRQARANGFQNALEGDFLAASYPDRSFDVIVSVELLEHIRDPLPFIRRTYDLLAPGGIYYATTPNMSGVNGRLLGIDWSIVCPPEHLHFFTPQSLAGALARVGFKSTRIACEGYNPFELLHTAKRGRDGPIARLDPVGAVTPRAFNQWLSASVFGRIAKATANHVLSLLRLGDTIKVRALK